MITSLIPRGRPFQAAASVIACIGATDLGLALAWTSPALPYIVDCSGADCDYNFSVSVGSWIGSLVNLGCLVSVFVTGYVMGKIGRKWTITLMYS